MLTLDGVPIRCITCGSTDLTDVGPDLDRHPMWYYECSCDAAWQLHTLITRQPDAPEPKRARTSDPETSQAAARLDFTGRRAQVVEALTALGTSHAGQVTDWINAAGYRPIQRSVASKRLGELVALGVVAETGTVTNDAGHDVTAYRLRFDRNDTP